MSENNKINIRKFNNNDYLSCFKNWCSDIEVTKFLSWQPHKNANETKIIIEKWINDYKNKIYQFAIVNSKNEPIGSIGINKVINEETIHIGYALSKQYWNLGIMTRVLKLFIDFIKNNTNYKYIQTFCNKENFASIKVLEKNNFELLGLTPNKIKDNYNFTHNLYFLYKI